MSHGTEAAPWRRELTIRPPGGSPLAMVPSWIVSVAVHVLLVFVFASGMKSCGGTFEGAEGDFRQVGIYVKPAAIADPSDSLDDSDDPARDAAFAADTAPRPEVEDRPPVDLSLPAQSQPLVGPGPLSPATLPTDVRDLSRANPIGTPGAMAAAGLGQGETAFMDIRDKGTRFVYVIDISGSMYGDPLLTAKSDLIASLNSLVGTQQFQVIFYNQSPHPMTLNRSDGTQLYWASDINKTLARQYTSGVQANGGTDHMPALKRALRLGPEVLFFLTDADYPILSAADLFEVQKLNQGRTRIHCIEFGSGPELNNDNFLKKLARQNGGSYRYRDVNEFRRR